eukprot:scaffold4419_cov31-Tisochrysis_lutea.AAC.8
MGRSAVLLRRFPSPRPLALASLLTVVGPSGSSLASPPLGWRHTRPTHWGVLLSSRRVDSLPATSARAWLSPRPAPPLPRPPVEGSKDPPPPHLAKA